MRSFIQIIALTFVFGMLVVLGVRMAKESSGGAESGRGGMMSAAVTARSIVSVCFSMSRFPEG